MTIYIALNTKLTEYSRYFKADDSELIEKLEEMLSWYQC